MAVKMTATEKFASNSKFYQILSRQSDKAISVENGSAENGTLLAVNTPDKNAPAQSWKLEPAADGYCRIVNTATGKSVDIISGGTENGAWLHQWDACDTDTQLWKLESSSRGYYKLISKASGKCVDIVDISCEEGAHLQIWDSVDGENQEWKLQELVSVTELQPQKAPAAKHRRGRRSSKKESVATAESVTAMKPAVEAKLASLPAEKSKTPISEIKESVKGIKAANTFAKSK